MLLVMCNGINIPTFVLLHVGALILFNSKQFRIKELGIWQVDGLLESRVTEAIFMDITVM
jgi:hypothetical protein